uniref:Uncharacterized LOC102682622 n=1 Tax=Lepisosteus oculatus TaxID=7918 RepID=W5MBR2_LEPOC
MPLFRGPQWQREKAEKGRSRGQVRTLVRLCLVSLADNMRELWARDYAENYMDSYSFRYVMGPFSLLPGELVEELLAVVCASRRASRAALHLLLVPQLRRLCLRPCSGLVTAPLCQLIALRCQELLALDLSGCQRVPPAVLAQLAAGLRRLRSLVLSGGQCDGDVVAAVAEGCPVLQHLDVSCCSGLPPWALLHLAYLPSRRRCTHHPLRSLLATDIGLGAGERESVGSAAFLLLGLPRLERLGHEGAAEACALLERGGFEGHDAFAVPHGFPTLQGALGMRLGAEGAGRRDGGGGGGSSSGANEEEVADGKEEECLSRETEGVEDGQGEGCGSSLMERGGEVRGGGQGSGGTGEGGRCITLRLKEVHGVTCRDLGSLGRLCPEIRALSLSCEDAAWLDRRLGLWDRLAELSVQFPGSLAELLPALGPAGPRLVSLSLSGLWLDSATSLTRLLHCCPSLRALQLHPQPPSPEQLGEEEEEE